jgi:nicotinamidase-related amidase
MPARQAVIVIDMLHDFVHGELNFDRAADIVEPLQVLLSAARTAAVPIIYTSDAHEPGDPEMKIWGEHAMRGTPGAAVIAELAPQEGDDQVFKRTYSAFYETDLESLLRELEVDTLLITGIHTHICVLHTAADAFYRGFAIEVVSDCVQAFTEEDHTHGLGFLQTMYGAKLVAAAEVLSEWQQTAG